MNIDTYERSYVEVLEILKYIPKDEYNRIPKELIEFFYKNCDKNYKFIYEPNIENISKKTYAIIINLYKNYIATDKRKNIIEKALLYNSYQEDIAKREKYNIDNIFKNNKKINIVKETAKEENKSLDIIRNKWYEKILKFIKKILFHNKF